MLLKNIMLKRLRNPITVWCNPVNDGYNNLTYDAPITLHGLYFYKHEKHQSEDGDVIATSLVLYCDTLLSVGDVIALGEFTNPSPINDSYQIERVTIYTTIYENEKVYRYYLRDSDKGYKTM